jgi:glyoxylase-like metal-dependent hydrolase (beta-lactamase superfamily II)
MIPFVRDMSFDYGLAQQVSPLVRRVVARNPGPFTYTGTGAHIVGRGQVAVIDPGPDSPAHLDALLKALEGETVTHIFVTHAHLDHSPAARPLAEATGALIYAGGEPCRPSQGDDRLEAGDDLAFRPDVALRDRQRFSGLGWTIEAVATPGHTASHYAFGLLDEHVLFPGDCVMGWSTSVVSPPDGDMADYMDSLAKIRARGWRTLLPAHGPPITEVEPFLAAYVAHRRRRSAAIVDALEAMGPATVRRLVAVLYADVDRRLHPAAAHTVLAHLIQLVREGRVECAGPPAIGAVYRPRRLRKAA